jgi:hypothetical protein
MGEGTKFLFEFIFGAGAACVVIGDVCTDEIVLLFISVVCGEMGIFGAKGMFPEF